MLIVYGHGFNPLSSSTWFRADSYLYYSIATDGYTLYPSDGSDGVPLGTWMGNAGWMPLYPWLIRLLLLLRLPTSIAAIGPVLACHFGALWLLWNRFLQDVSPARGFGCLLLAAFFPGMIYQHAASPVSMLTFLVLLCGDQLSRQRGWAAGVAGFLAGMTYATGFALSPVIALLLLLPPYSPQQPRSTILRRAAVLGCMPFVGFCVVCAVLQITVGAWHAFFLIQEHYGHGLNNPLMTLYLQFSVITRTEPVMQAFRMNVLPELVVVAVMVIALVIVAASSWMRRTVAERYLALFAVTFWIFPLVMGLHVFPVRPHACLLPIVVLLRKLPVWAQGILLAGFFVLSVQTSKLFLTIPNL